MQGAQARFKVGDLVLIEKNIFDRNEDELGLVLSFTERKLLPGQSRTYIILVRGHREMVFESEMTSLCG